MAVPRLVLVVLPPTEIVEFVTTSGTVGDPLSIMLSRDDLNRLAYNEAISIACTGHKQGMKYQLMTTIDKRFMAGLAYTLGVHSLNGGLIRVGPGVPELQWDSIQRFKPEVIIAVPSFIMKLIQYAKTNNIDFKNSSIQKAICIGEPIRNLDYSLNALGEAILSEWNIHLFSTYASTEMSTAFTECYAGKGGHLHPELIYVELLDENDQPVNDGEYGEVTVTTIGVQAMPLLRFKTGDVCRIDVEPCICGRNTPRLSPLIGRKQHMIKLKGTTIFPATVYDLLNQMKEILLYQLHVSLDEYRNDSLVIKIAIDNSENTDSIVNKLKEKCRSILRVTPIIQIEKMEELKSQVFKETHRKPIYFVDHRI